MFQELIDNLTNVEVFTGSVSEWIGGLSILSLIHI